MEEFIAQGHLKESNDLTLFAWVMSPDRAAGQIHWGVLAPSPREFASCNDIETRFDAMHCNECAVTSKGVRVTPVHGGELRPGREGMETGSYVMSLQCYRRNALQEEDLAIALQQVGCDFYARVRPDALYIAPHRFWYDEDNTRVFYVAKTVSPERSGMLRASIGRAISLSRALEVLGNQYGIWPARTGAFVPVGHWDGQRKLFLTKGVRKFCCSVKLESRAGKRMAMTATSAAQRPIERCHRAQPRLQASVRALSPLSVAVDTSASGKAARAAPKTCRIGHRRDRHQTRHR